MMKRTLLRFYTDTHIAKAVAVQLTNRGVDIIRCEDVGMAEAADIAHLEYAAENDRAIVTRDADFLRHHVAWLAQGKTHGGIFFVQDHLQGKGSIGVIVIQLFEYYEYVVAGAATIEADIQNRIMDIS